MTDSQNFDSDHSDIYNHQDAGSEAWSDGADDERIQSHDNEDDDHLNILDREQAQALTDVGDEPVEDHSFINATLEAQGYADQFGAVFDDPQLTTNDFFPVYYPNHHLYQRHAISEVGSFYDTVTDMAPYDSGQFPGAVRGSRQNLDSSYPPLQAAVVDVKEEQEDRTHTESSNVYRFANLVQRGSQQRLLKDEKTDLPDSLSHSQSSYVTQQHAASQSFGEHAELYSAPEPTNRTYQPKSGIFKDAAAAKAYRKGIWRSKSPQDDPTIVEVEENQAEWVEKLYQAIINTKGVFDGPRAPSGSGIRDPRGWKAFQPGGFEQEQVEAACWHVLGACLKLHKVGRRFHDQWDKSKKEADWDLNCRARLEALVNMFRRWKNACYDAVAGCTVEWMVNHPSAIVASKKGNQTGNRSKAEMLKAGKEHVNKRKFTAEVDNEQHVEEPEMRTTIARPLRKKRGGKMTTKRPAARDHSEEAIEAVTNNPPTSAPEAFRSIAQQTSSLELPVAITLPQSTFFESHNIDPTLHNASIAPASIMPASQMLYTPQEMHLPQQQYFNPTAYYDPDRCQPTILQSASRDRNAQGANIFTSQDYLFHTELGVQTLLNQPIGYPTQVTQQDPWPTFPNTGVTERTQAPSQRRNHDHGGFVREQRQISNHSPSAIARDTSGSQGEPRSEDNSGATCNSGPAPTGRRRRR